MRSSRLQWNCAAAHSDCASHSAIQRLDGIFPTNQRREQLADAARCEVVGRGGQVPECPPVVAADVRIGSVSANLSRDGPRDIVSLVLVARLAVPDMNVPTGPDARAKHYSEAGLFPQLSEGSILE